MTDSADLRWLRDRECIRDVLRRYARGVDRKDWDLVRGAFHPDAFDDHGPYKGGVDGFLAMVQERHRAISQSIHMVTDSFIEFADEANALVESSYLVYQTVHSEPGACDVEEHDVIGRYVDHFRLAEGEWRIQHRTVVVEQFRVARREGIREVPAGWRTAERDGGDVVQRERARLAIG